MDIDKVKKILDKMPVKSEYEFKHFEMESQGSWHRQMRYALARSEELHHMLEMAEADVDIQKYAIGRVDKDYKKGEVDARKRVAQAQLALAERHASNIRKDLEQVNKWLEGHKPEECADAANTFEQSESDNWTEQLGREVGLEVLADSKSSKESMVRMSLLPLADFKKSVMITNQFAAFLKKTTEQVEATLMTNRPTELPAAVKPAAEEAAPAPAKAAAADKPATEPKTSKK